VVEAKARAYIAGQRLPAALAYSLVVVTWLTIFGLVGLLAWKLLEVNLGMRYVVSGEVLGVEDPLRLELPDLDVYTRESDERGRRVYRWVLLTRGPILKRCFQMRVVTREGLPPAGPDGQLRPPFELEVSQDEHVSLRYEPEQHRMRRMEGGAGDVGRSCRDEASGRREARGTRP